MITLFILSSREVWIYTMFYAQDANDKQYVKIDLKLFKFFN